MIIYPKKMILTKFYYQFSEVKASLAPKKENGASQNY